MSSDPELLQKKLNELFHHAKSNEQKQQKFQDYELALLNSVDLPDLISIILDLHLEQFQLTDVTLLLLDPDDEIKRLLDSDSKLDRWKGRLLFSDSDDNLRQNYHISQDITLANFSSQQHQSLFPNQPHSLKTVAILPLIRRNKLIGSFNLASHDADRFQTNIGTQFLQHLAAVSAACIENMKLHENIKQLGLLDPLTGVNNRRFFDQRAQEEITLTIRNKASLSCLFIDIDHFKKINDLHGHQAGDAVLKHLASLLNSTMRTSDLLARYGGEEFVVILTNTGNDAAYDIAERIRTKISTTPFDIGSSEPLSITLSIGLTTINDRSDITTTSQLVIIADQAMYAAKNAGRDNVYQTE